MIKTSYALCSALIVAVGFSQVHAAVVYTSPDGFYDLNLTDATPVGSTEDLVSVILQVVSKRPGDAQANAATFNGSIGGNGALHHERLFNALASPTNTSWSGAGQTPSAIDSYFNNVGLTITAPAEAGSPVASSEPALSNAANGTDFGYSLTANIGLATQGVTTNIAQLVGKSGSMINMDFIVANGIIGATPSVFQGSFMIGGTVGPVDPVAVGNPPSGSSISLQGAFNDGTGVLADAITLTNSATGSDPLSITSLAITNDAEGLFSATFDGLSIDLGLDIAKSLAGPPRNVSALLTVTTNGGVLTYNLGARVPEPSTVALSALALVGLVGFARRKK